MWTVNSTNNMKSHESQCDPEVPKPGSFGLALCQIGYPELSQEEIQKFLTLFCIGPNPEIQKSGRFGNYSRCVDVQKIWKSGNPKDSGTIPDVRTRDAKRIRNSARNFRISGFPDFRKFQTSGLPDFQLSRFQRFEGSEVFGNPVE